MILDPRTVPLMRGLTILQPGIMLFSGRGLRCSRRPWFHRGGTAVDDTGQVCSDSEVSDCWSSSGGGGGAWAPTVDTTVCCARLDCFDCDVPVRVPDLSESGRAREKCLSVLGHVDDVLPDVSPVMSARAAAVPMSLSTVGEVMSSAVLAGGGGGRS